MTLFEFKVYRRACREFGPISLEDAKKFFALLYAVEAERAEENERIHKAAYEAAMGDHYGTD